jgi:exosortase J
MGLIAVVTGYIYRFRWFAIALVTAGAVLLGYVFNLLRLCMLVFYYMVALHLPSLQSKAEQADYIIGATLFLIAALLLFSAIDWLRDRGSAKMAVAASAPAGGADVARGQWARVLALGALAAAGCLSIPQALAMGRARPAPQGVQPFPERIGSYRRERTWNESGDGVTVVYMWAQYAPAAGGTPVAIGISPVDDWHNPLICHSIRGDAAVWQGQMTASTAEAPVEFSSALYNDGVTQLLEVSTLCGRGSCGEFVTRRRNFGFIYNFPRVSAETVKPARATRILLKIENRDPNEPSEAVRRELTGQMQQFLAAADLDEMARPFGQ